jgi:hypothetical protein
MTERAGWALLCNNCTHSGFCCQEGSPKFPLRRLPHVRAMSSLTKRDAIAGLRVGRQDAVGWQPFPDGLVDQVGQVDPVGRARL